SYLSNGLVQTLLDAAAPTDPRPLATAANPARYAGTYKFGSDFYGPGQEIGLGVSHRELVEHQTGPDRLRGLGAARHGTVLDRSHWGPVTFAEKATRVTSLTFNGFTATRAP